MVGVNTVMSAGSSLIAECDDIKKEEKEKCESMVKYKREKKITFILFIPRTSLRILKSVFKGAVLGFLFTMTYPFSEGLLKYIEEEEKDQ